MCAEARSHNLHVDTVQALLRSHHGRCAENRLSAESHLYLCPICTPGLQFGSLFAGGRLPGATVDYLPEEQPASVTNLSELAGMLILDKWTCNSDGRQAVYVRKPHKRAYSAVFIDQGYCFNGVSWKYHDLPIGGVCPRDVVYAHVTGWESFSPWLKRVEAISEEAIHQHCSSIPKEWYEGDISAVQSLAKGLVARKSIIRELISDFRSSVRHPFPLWKD